MLIIKKKSSPAGVVMQYVFTECGFEIVYYSNRATQVCDTLHEMKIENYICYYTRVLAGV